MSALSMMRAAPAFVDYQQTLQGLPGPGVPNLTARIPPPQRPQPEEEQGVGRGPGERWEHRTHNVDVNPYWYLDTPYLYDVPLDGSLPVGQEVPLPIEFALNVYENQRQERQLGPGAAGVTAVVPNPRSYTQTQLRILAATAR